MCPRTCQVSSAKVIGACGSAGDMESPSRFPMDIATAVAMCFACQKNQLTQRSTGFLVFIPSDLGVARQSRPA